MNLAVLYWTRAGEGEEEVAKREKSVGRNATTEQREEGSPVV